MKGETMKHAEHTPETIPLTRYEDDYEMRIGVATGQMFKDCNWLTEFFMLGQRTTRGTWITEPSPTWAHVSRIKHYDGTNENNIRNGHRQELEHICNVLNEREKTNQ